MRRIGILTSGGDCQGLNAAIRGVAKGLYERFGDQVELYGIHDGYRGLIFGDYRFMQQEDFSGILTLGGTILGTSRQPFKLMRVADENIGDKVRNMKDNYKKLKLDCLVVLGGNGTHKTANLLAEEGLHVVTLPKTIDNDVWGTDVTFGFHSALSIATNVVDCIHTTATAHGRVFLIELMGNKAGWLTLNAGIAGGADVILLPEIPYSIDSLIDALEERDRQGKRFSIVTVAEGALSRDEAKMSKKELKAYRADKPSSIAYRLARQVGDRVGREIRVAVPGHIQRGGSPCPYDRVLATRFGAAAAGLVAGEKYGCMVGMRGLDIVAVPLREVAGKLKNVPPDAPEIQAARSIGVKFGDE